MLGFYWGFSKYTIYVSGSLRLLNRVTTAPAVMERYITCISGGLSFFNCGRSACIIRGIVENASRDSTVLFL
jgi:hypothetical protein